MYNTVQTLKTGKKLETMNPSMNDLQKKIINVKKIFNMIRILEGRETLSIF